jgi:hypothetical protein
MHTNKQTILSEIRRIAEANDGTAPGKGTFEQQTGIRSTEWEGRYWTKWSDAVVEAGLQPNRFGSPAYDERVTLTKVAELTRELGHLPNRNEIRLRKRSDPKLPNDNTLRNKFGNKEALITRLLQFAESAPEWEDVVEILREEKLTIYSTDISGPADVSERSGYVYLIRHGRRREYKIGSTYNAIRREGELALQLPEKVSPIHFIETDDPSGVEAYWHRRFAAKRKNGEWFELSISDIKVYKFSIYPTPRPPVTQIMPPLGR